MTYVKGLPYIVRWALSCETSQQLENVIDFLERFVKQHKKTGQSIRLVNRLYDKLIFLKHKENYNVK